jgi:hypothetical protein
LAPGAPGIDVEMVVAGVEISLSAAGLLALLLDEAGEADLAQRIGLAIDANSRGVGIRADEHATVLAVLENPPADLRPLRDALRKPRSRKTERVQASSGRASSGVPHGGGTRVAPNGERASQVRASHRGR